MCGRFTLSSTSRVAEAFGLAGPIAKLNQRYNIAPIQAVAVRGLALLRRGLVPSWSNDPSTCPKQINACSDSLDEPMFRQVFRSKWSLIPADGFFEWSTVGGQMRATHFRMRDRLLFAFAGLCEFWSDGVEKLATCCIITTDAKELVGTIHNRMPVVLPKVDYAPWLSPETGIAEVKGMLRPYPAAEMEAVTVGPAINSPRNGGPDVLNSA